MNNSDLLKYDYSQPTHLWYKLYVSNINYGYDEVGYYERKDAWKIPNDLDNYYYPQYVYFLIKGRNMDGGDELVDGGNILQETNRYQRKREKKKRWDDYDLSSWD